MKQKIISITLCVIWVNIAICKAQGSEEYSNTRSSKTSNHQSNYSNNPFKIVSSYKVGENYIVLEKKLDNNYYRTNGDRIKFYKTTFSIGLKSGNRTERTIIETDAYTSSDKSFDRQSQPCMMIDPQKQVIYIFSNSKSTDPYYGMDGYIYRVDLDKKHWTREVVFKGANYGWFSFFGGSNNGNPELWHFAYNGYHIVKSVRNSSGLWNNYNMGSIRPEQASAQYDYHRNILVTSSPDVDQMSANYVKKDNTSASNSLVSGVSDKTLMTGAAFVTVGAMVYGLFKLLGSGGASSNVSSGSSSSTLARQETEAQKSIDPNSMSWPAPRYDSGWERLEGYDDGRMEKWVNWSYEKKLIRIVCVFPHKDYVRTYIVSGVGRSYKNYQDAEAAAYFWQIHKLQRTRGQK